MNDPITRSIKVLVEYFDKHNIDYVIVGGIAVLVFGRTRVTTDVDIIFDHRKVDRNNFIEYLQKNNFDITMSDMEILDDGMRASIFEKGDMFRIDMKGINGINEQRSIDLSLEIDFQGIKVKFDNPLNIVAFKLFFGSEQDFEDALAVYVRNQDIIEIDKLRKLCSELNVTDVLNELLDELN
ncbi:MAG: nucleotidyltransferase [Candidatus Heimdallarchaeota archaeon]|nr:nucleotidyltransferase [Candidatus Heimdallarchaeota archaeon]